MTTIVNFKTEKTNKDVEIKENEVYLIKYRETDKNDKVESITGRVVSINNVVKKINVDNSEKYKSSSKEISIYAIDDVVLVDETTKKTT